MDPSERSPLIPSEKEESKPKLSTVNPHRIFLKVRSNMLECGLIAHSARLPVHRGACLPVHAQGRPGNGDADQSAAQIPLAHLGQYARLDDQACRRRGPTISAVVSGAVPRAEQVLAHGCESVSTAREDLSHGIRLLHVSRASRQRARLVRFS